MLQQMFEVTSSCCHTAMQTFVPQIDSVVDLCRWNPWKASSVTRQRAL